jgi:hypothetical protein
MAQRSRRRWSVGRIVKQLAERVQGAAITTWAVRHFCAKNIFSERHLPTDCRQPACQNHRFRRARLSPVHAKRRRTGSGDPSSVIFEQRSLAASTILVPFGRQRPKGLRPTMSGAPLTGGSPAQLIGSVPKGHWRRPCKAHSACLARADPPPLSGPGKAAIVQCRAKAWTAHALDNQKR